MAKASTSERLTDTNIEKVIGLLEAEKPITKKAACEILGITYNTTRLGDLIQKYKDKITYRKEMYAKKRGKPAALDEITDIVRSYLQGDTLSNLADSNFRTTDFIKKVLTTSGVSIRDSDSNYWKPAMILDEAVKKEFKLGERCFAVRYQSLATIEGILTHNDGPVYRVWLEAEDQQQFAYQPWWELASLDKLTQQGIKI
jgi:hypothetical protein